MTLELDADDRSKIERANDLCQVASKSSENELILLYLDYKGVYISYVFILCPELKMDSTGGLI